MSTDNRVAIFIDAESLTQWIKQGGLDAFLEELTALGPVVVRKAYARWTSSSVTAHQSTLTAADMRKATGLLLKAGLVQHQGKNAEEENLWRVIPASDETMLRAVDRAMLVRLMAGLDETSTALDVPRLQPLLFGKYDATDLTPLLAEAKKARRTERADGTSIDQTGSNNGADPIR